MKIFISQPMYGKTEKQIRDERKYLVKELQELGFDVIDSIIKDFDDEVSPIIYLAKSIEMLDKADLVIFMQGWENSRGCIIEHEVARRYGKFIKEI